MAPITLFYWLHTCPLSGKRRRTRYRLSEDEAGRRLIDPVKIEHGALVVEPVAVTPAGVWRSGLMPETDDEGRVPPSG